MYGVYPLPFRLPCSRLYHYGNSRATTSRCNSCKLNSVCGLTRLSANLCFFFTVSSRYPAELTFPINPFEESHLKSILLTPTRSATSLVRYCNNFWHRWLGTSSYLCTTHSISNYKHLIIMRSLSLCFSLLVPSQSCGWKRPHHKRK